MSQFLLMTTAVSVHETFEALSNTVRSGLSNVRTERVDAGARLVEPFIDPHHHLWLIPGPSITAMLGASNKFGYGLGQIAPDARSVSHGSVLRGRERALAFHSRL